MFMAAVMDFGKVDAIGHAPIVAVFLAIAADARPERDMPGAARLPLSYAGGLACVIGTYYGAHAALFGTRIF